MKTIQHKDYRLDSIVGYWYQFSNRHYDGIDSERLLVKRAKVILEDGSYIYLDPIKKHDKEMSSKLALYSKLNR